MKYPVRRGGSAKREFSGVIGTDQLRWRCNATRTELRNSETRSAVRLRRAQAAQRALRESAERTHHGYATLALAEFEGRKIEKAVPTPWMLRTRRRPPCFSTSVWETHSPSPVPFSPLVLKKGSKILWRTSRGMPKPVSAITMRTPFRPAAFQSGES